MYIKIIKCSDKSYWYSKYIGKVCNPVFYDEPSASYVIGNIDGTNKRMGSVVDGDYEEVEVFDKEDLFVPPTPPKTETELLREELELTQAVINNLLMGGTE